MVAAGLDIKNRLKAYSDRVHKSVRWLQFFSLCCTYSKYDTQPLHSKFCKVACKLVQAPEIQKAPAFLF